MNINKLKELVSESLVNPNYQYKDLSKSDFQKMAGTSFYRLPENQKALVITSWKSFCLTAGEDGKAIDYKLSEAAEYRFLAQTNLYFLGHLLEKYKDTTVETHEDICNQFFVQKNPTFNTFQEFALSLPPSYLKKTMLLVPRGGFKSSIDMADTVQWIICFPEITILILTGVLSLATDFVREIKSHFTFEQISEDAKGKATYGTRKMYDGSSNLFQVLFPEHCVEPQEGKATEFITPACKTPDKEPTLRAASIEQNLSGMHFGVMKLDDVVTNENSLTIDRMKGVNRQININRAMLHPFGFMDVIGTWYDDQDYYGITISEEEKIANEEGMMSAIQGSVDSGKFNSEVTFKIYLRAAWWPTEAAKKAGKIADEMKKEDYDLWFPSRLTYEFLKQEQRTDRDGFPIKYLNNPRMVHQIKFPRELLLRRTILPSMLPKEGMLVSVVDTAYSIKDWADFTVMITALIYAGRFYVIDMTRGRFNEYELPAVIAATGYKWKPKRIAIEDSMGVKWMGRELRREMDRLQITIPVEYVSLGLGSKSKSKELKAKPVLRLLGDERLFFSKSCTGLEDLYSELEKFRGDDKGHDDIVSALSILVDQFSAYADMDGKISFVQSQYVSDQQEKERHDMVYGLGKYARFNVNTPIEDNPVTQYHAENLKTAEISDIDPLRDIF